MTCRSLQDRRRQIEGLCHTARRNKGISSRSRPSGTLPLTMVCPTATHCLY